MAKTLFQREGKYHLVVRENDGRVRFYDDSDEGCTLDFSRPVVIEDSGSPRYGTYAWVPVVEDCSYTVTAVSRGIQIAQALGLVVDFRNDDEERLASVNFATV